VTELDLIMNALVAGAGAAASGAGKDAYVHLKNLLTTKFKDHREASRALSAGDIDEEKWRTTITDALRTSGAAEDPAVQEAAKRVRVLLTQPRNGDISYRGDHGVLPQINGDATFTFIYPPTPSAAG
jgi:hypothetical protein